MRIPVRSILLLVLTALAALAAPAPAAEPASGSAQFRPPAVPLVAVDPYFSIWSCADKLTDVPTTHWSHLDKAPVPHRLQSQIIIDGSAPFRLMGDAQKEFPPLPQVGFATILPTRTIYEFEGQGIHLTMTFMTPAIPEDLMLLSRPITYLTWTLRAVDGKEHTVQIEFQSGAELAVNTTDQEVEWSDPKFGEITTKRVGSVDQPVLGRKGDRVRIDWGYHYAAVAADQHAITGYAPHPSNPSTIGGRSRAETASMSSIGFGNFKVGAQPVERWLMLAYDDIYAIQYFYKNVKAYWKKDGAEIGDLLQLAAKEYESIKARCAKFDEELMADLTAAGGAKYAQICALAHRQSFAASKVVADANGQPLFFPKENSSNGCIGTVDVFYPQAPQLLFFSPALSKAVLVPVLDYASSPRWKFPFAPHDVGTWPKANGQVYGGGERTEENQMPVEETGNMLLLLAAVAKMDGNADFAAKYWPTLVRWAEFLKSKGFDPENQLCTDDFAGHLAHNINLSVKAICALGAFAKLAELKGEKAQAEEYGKIAREFAARWVREAADGDHYKLTFDKPGTWSQKYNLVWDRILGLGLFPESVARQEMDYYKKIQNRYGLPLDSRKDYTKLDWTLWTATLTGDRADFDAIVDPVYTFYNETPSRVPMTDWCDTKTGLVVGFISRPVVGGMFIKMLYNDSVWKKWSTRDATKLGVWAPLPKPPKVSTVVPAANEQAAEWKYTTRQPGPAWNKPNFDDSKWKTGKSGFGAEGTPGAAIGTEWKTPDIWIRREITLPQGKFNDLQLLVHHDEDIEIFINGVEAARLTDFVTDYITVPIKRRAYEAMKSNKIIIAAHCHQTRGGQYCDIGLVDVIPQE